MNKIVALFTNKFNKTVTNKKTNINSKLKAFKNICYNRNLNSKQQQFFT